MSEPLDPPAPTQHPAPSTQHYVELHCHSNYSMLDGASHPEELVARAKALGMPALAITDHDGLYGAVRFWQAALEEGIRPIVGAEVTMDGGYHLTLLARDRQGYSNLCRLISTAQLAHGKNQSSLAFDTLAENSSGLICLSGCRKGEMASHLLAGSRRRAQRAAERLLQIFGHDSFWVELQHHMLLEDDWLCAELADIARRLGAGCVATNNVHYALREGHRLQDILVCIKSRTTLDASDGVRRPNSEYHLKSAREMADRFAWCPGAVANSVLIAEQCQVDLNFKGYRFPGFQVPEGDTPFSYLYRLCQEGTAERFQPITPAVSKQLAHELDVIYKTGLAEYFLIVWDIMRYSREQHIPGQGRGSAADSLVAYVLGITQVDPIRHDLLFERFLSEEMTGMPDIDIDFSSNHREQIIQYVYEKYGQDYTAMVCNVVTYRARNALREVGKAMGMPPDLLDRFAKAVNRHSPSKLGMELSIVAPEDGLNGLMEEEGWSQLLDFCRQIEGFPRHLSIHVGGMLITATPLVEIAPLERATAPGRVVVQFNKDDVEDMGLIKMDLLGLRTLSVVHDALEMIRETRGEDLRLDRLSLDDPAVYDMLCEPDNIGVFQVESRAQSQTLPKMKPRSIGDLIVEISIIRPGPLQGNMVHPYLRRRAGQEEVVYLHPCLEPALRETLGVVLFQEQVIRVAVAAASFTPGEADMFRRAMNRHRTGLEMERIRVRFLEGAQRNGLAPEVAEEIFRQLRGFAAYGFCKSHAAAFAKTAYDTAYLKLYYAPEFYTAILNNQPMGFYSPEVVANDARHHGIEVLPVDVNRSRGKCTVEDGNIRMGFSYVHGLGDASVQRLEEERERGQYRSLDEFLHRTRLYREAVENLIAVGAMDCFGRPRREMLWEAGAWAAQEAGGKGSSSLGTGRRGKVGNAGVKGDAAGQGAAVGMGSVVTTGSAAGQGSVSLGVSGGRKKAGEVVPFHGKGERGEREHGEGVGGCRDDREGEERVTPLILLGGIRSLPAMTNGLRPHLVVPEGLRPHPNPLPEGEGIVGPSPSAVRSADSTEAAGGDSSPLSLWERARVRALPIAIHDTTLSPFPGSAIPTSLINDSLEIPPLPSPSLPSVSVFEETAAQYSLLGLSTGRHAVELFRDFLADEGVIPCGRLSRLPAQLVVRVGGLVVCEQAPPTAKGHVFLTLEDETGLANVILRPQIYQRFRKVLRTNQIILVDGLLARQDGITNLMARKISSLHQAALMSAGASKRPHRR